MSGGTDGLASGRGTRALAWTLAIGFAVLVAIFFVMLSGKDGSWASRLRHDHPGLVPLIALGLILLSPLSVLLYHRVAGSAAADRRASRP